MAIVENLSPFEDKNGEWKTYYIRIFADGGVFFKFGVCKSTLNKRFSSEPITTRIDIIKLWPHKSEISAERHETKLFKFYTGDRPFIGRCGPLLHGGNTETYSHDVFHSQRAPHSYIVKMYSNSHGILYTSGYSCDNPRERYSYLYGKVSYMDYLWGPEDCGEGCFYQIPEMSSADRVTICTSSYLDYVTDDRTPLDRCFHRQFAIRAKTEKILCNTWRDYKTFLFEGARFKIDKWADWV